MTDRRLRSPRDLDGVDFAKGEGLVPVVVQDEMDGAVLMVAWADRTAVERTLETGEVHFFSRSRGELWRKGATSGNVLRLRSLHADCDADTLLARVCPTGPACHTGERSCFGDAAEEAHVLGRLWSVLRARARERPEGSYTLRLLDDENLRTKKLGEECAELVAALAKGEADRIPEEGADLLYHLLVALLGGGSSLDALLAELEARRGG